jgi:hypothetical protein
VAREEAGALRRQVTVIPHDDVLIASDDPHGTVGATYVPEVSRSSATLASLTVRRPVERALDIGTGNGIQAVLASHHADAVVATDVSERALAFAEFNCALNGVDNVELRLGSFLEPVAGERFGLVVSNPPFAISPEHDLAFPRQRPRPRPGQRGAPALVAAVLEPDGYASMTAAWIVEGEDSSRAAARVARAGGLRRLGAPRGAGRRHDERLRLDRKRRLAGHRTLARLLRARAHRARRLRSARAAAQER